MFSCQVSPPPCSMIRKVNCTHKLCTRGPWKKKKNRGICPGKWPSRLSLVSLLYVFWTHTGHFYLDLCNFSRKRCPRNLSRKNWSFPMLCPGRHVYSTSLRWEPFWQSPESKMIGSIFFPDLFPDSKDVCRQGKIETDHRNPTLTSVLLCIRHLDRAPLSGKPW